MKRLIDEEDAIRAICKNCYAEDGGDYKDCRYYPCDDVQAIEALPSTDLERIKAIMKKANEQDNHIGRPTDIISRADAIEAVDRWKDYDGDICWREAIDKAKDALSALPSAEAVQGEWVKTSDGNGWNEWYVLKCPICGATIEDKHYHSWKYNFCPNCGAKMKDGDNNEID